MDIIIGLFWIGFLICAALFVFNLVIGFVFGFFALVVGGFAAIFDKIRGN